MLRGMAYTLAGKIYIKLLGLQNKEQVLKRLVAKQEEYVYIQKDDLDISDVTTYSFRDDSYIVNDNGFIYLGTTHRSLLHPGDHCGVVLY